MAEEQVFLPADGAAGDAQFAPATSSAAGGCCSKVQSAICSLLLGICLLPFSWYVLGFNEHQFVCTEKDILYAESSAQPTACDAAESQLDSPVFFSCPLDVDSLKVFTPATFNQAMQATDLGSSLRFSSVAGTQQAWMWQCIESSRREGDGQNQKVIYAYSAEWSAMPVDSSRYSQSLQAQRVRSQACPGFVANPPWPANLRTQTVSEVASSVKAGSFVIQGPLMASFLDDDMVPVDLRAFAQGFAASSQLKPPGLAGYASLSTANTAVDLESNKLVTCPKGFVTFGCMTVEYRMSPATAASVITRVAAGSATSPIDTPPSWGCTAGSWETLRTKQMSKQEMIAAAMSENQTTTWLMRVVGCLLAWMAVYCCLQPISVAADLIGDVLNIIPCVGSFLQDLVEGVVDCVLCVVSCGLGCSTALVVIGIVWIVMRPLYGGILLGVAFVLMGVGIVLARANRNPMKRPLGGRTFDLEQNQQELEALK